MLKRKGIGGCDQRRICYFWIMEYTDTHYNFYHHSLPQFFLGRDIPGFPSADGGANRNNLLMLWETEVTEAFLEDELMDDHGILPDKTEFIAGASTDFMLVLHLEACDEPTAPLFVIMTRKNGERRYFTYERSYEPNEEGACYFLCSWDRDGVHENYGEHTSQDADYVKGLVRSLVS